MLAVGEGQEGRGSLRLESVWPHPLRAGTVLVSHPWCSSPKAEWELPADETMWGGGTATKGPA